MDICFNADINYLRPLLISVSSVCENNVTPIAFHIINYGGIEEHYFKFLTEKFEISVTIYNATNEMLIMQGHGRFPPVVYGRLFIPELINVDKVLYLDVDTITTGSLLELWEQPCQYIRAVEETDNKISSALKMKYSLTNYYNAGVLLINNLSSIELFKDSILIARTKRLNYLDQDAVNIAFDKKIDSLESDFNFMAIVNKSSEIPTIIHFAHLKPWKRVCLHQYSYIYKQYEKLINEHLPESDELKNMSLKEFLKNIYMRLS